MLDASRGIQEKRRRKLLRERMGRSSSEGSEKKEKLGRKIQAAEEKITNQEESTGKLGRKSMYGGKREVPPRGTYGF